LETSDLPLHMTRGKIKKGIEVFWVPMKIL